MRVLGDSRATRRRRDVALTLATSSGVEPSSFARSISAPLSSNIRAASTWPFSQAVHSGVVPFSVAWLISAPPSRSRAIASTSPVLAAASSG